jgi:SAM-dependent methyltransferase
MDEQILARYNSPEGLADYSKKFERHWTERVNNWHEQRLLRELLDAVPRDSGQGIALDLPCGYGRLYPLVRERAKRVVEGDWSFQLLAAAHSFQSQEPQFGAAAGYVRATALALPFADRAFHLVLSVRLCHHIREHSERTQYVNELMRVSKQWLAFTYFDESAIKNRWHDYRRRYNGKRPKWTLQLKEIEALSQAQGFKMVRCLWMSRFFSGHRYLLLQRTR